MKEKKFELELSWICPETSFLHQAITKEPLAELTQKAQETLDKEAMADVQP